MTVDQSTTVLDKPVEALNPTSPPPVPAPTRENTYEQKPRDGVSSQPLRSTHSTTFPEILQQLGISLLVTTYQAGKLLALRAMGNGSLNTHFRDFRKPMGLAVRGDRIAVGSDLEIHELHNMPAVAAKLEPPGKHDACFLPRTVHTTGDVLVHEMAWVDDELWFVNTQFSCLATRSDQYSFVPRWRPGFVTQLSPGDCCHLNGLCVVEGRAKYVTALGTSDKPSGWRDNKRDGGILIDVETNSIVARGLSMPHSPRWHDDRLWLLESGTGTFGHVDLDSGRYEPISKLPGFTRGLSIVGVVAFVALSQVRESAVFSGIPLVDELNERTCGVWAIDIRTGGTLGFVKFEDAVQEIFAVEPLLGVQYPDVINDDHEVLATSFVLPDEALADVPESLRSSV